MRMAPVNLFDAVVSCVGPLSSRTQEKIATLETFGSCCLMRRGQIIHFDQAWAQFGSSTMMSLDLALTRLTLRSGTEQDFLLKHPNFID